ncbi:MAG TPA: restriction endonuclease subunit M [Clostridiales bacterium]|nr:restriction endonuclease subunit M [Clostridiales bacterium]
MKNIENAKKCENKSQIKSKKRVAEHGEVFTNEREVKAMCDLVAQECDRIDSRFLEPACGDGNFLAEILTRKLATVKKLYKSNPYDFERYSVLAVTSVYGVDILADNVEECRARLFKLWNKEYKAICKKAVSDETREAVKYILSKNILCGNALTLMCVDENQKDTQTPIIFPEWSLMLGTKLKRRDFRLDVMLKANDKPKKGQPSLFDIPEEIREYISINPVTKEYMAEPICEYPPVHFRKVQENG